LSWGHISRREGIKFTERLRGRLGPVRASQGHRGFRLRGRYRKLHGCGRAAEPDKLRLFERTTRRLQLTDPGAAFYATCVRVLADLADAEAMLAADRSEIVGRLKVDVPIAFGRMQVMPLLLDFAGRYPKLRPIITFTDRVIDLVEERVDVAVRIGSAAAWPDSLGRRHLGSERVIVCAAPSFLAQHGPLRSADDLSRVDCILYGRADGTTAPWRLGEGDKPNQQRAMEGRFVLGSAEAQVGAVKAGFGVAQLATWLIKDALRPESWSRSCRSWQQRDCPCTSSGREATNSARRWMDC
jgi:DNA-binding transcriptional LysR family regulator